MRHCISNKDMAKRTGVCAIDGAVGLTTGGRCIIAARLISARQRAKTMATVEGRARCAESSVRSRAKTKKTPEGRARIAEDNARYHVKAITTPQGRERAGSYSRRSGQKRGGHKFPEMSSQEVEALVAMQNGRCLICDKEFQRQPDRDHDHKTGEFRGYLDDYCNLHIISFFDAAPPRLQWINTYLAAEKPELKSRQEKRIVAFFEKDAERLPRLNDFYAQAEKHIRYKAMIRLRFDLITSR